MVARRLKTERICRGKRGRGDQERVGNGVGGGSGNLSRGDLEGIQRHELEGVGGGRASGHVGKINVEGTTGESIIVKVTCSIPGNLQLIEVAP